jgi:hypothetical protein
MSILDVGGQRAAKIDPRTCKLADFADVIAARARVDEFQAQIDAAQARVRELSFAISELKMDEAVEEVLRANGVKSVGRARREEREALSERLEVLIRAKARVAEPLNETLAVRSHEMNKAVMPELRSMVRLLARKLCEAADIIRAIAALREDLGSRGAIFDAVFLSGVTPYIDGRWYGANSALDAWLRTMTGWGFLKSGENPRQIDEREGAAAVAGAPKLQPPIVVETWSVAREMANNAATERQRDRAAELDKSRTYDPRASY